MNRDEILELLLKDKSHDELIERPELYSIEEDIYQWMFETRDYWNEKIPKIMEHEKTSYEELKGMSQNTTGSMRQNTTRRKIIESKPIGTTASVVDSIAAVCIGKYPGSGESFSQNGQNSQAVAHGTPFGETKSGGLWETTNSAMRLASPRRNLP